VAPSSRNTTIDPVALNTPFGGGLELGLRLCVADAIADGPAVSVVLGATGTLAEGLAEPPPQPEMARAPIQITSSGFATRKGSLIM
jgi:hypothetical protein